MCVLHNAYQTFPWQFDYTYDGNRRGSGNQFVFILNINPSDRMGKKAG